MTMNNLISICQLGSQQQQSISNKHASYLQSKDDSERIQRRKSIQKKYSILIQSFNQNLKFDRARVKRIQILRSKRQIILSKKIQKPQNEKSKPFIKNTKYRIYTSTNPIPNIRKSMDIFTYESRHNAACKRQRNQNGRFCSKNDMEITEFLNNASLNVNQPFIIVKERSASQESPKSFLSFNSSQLKRGQQSFQHQEFLTPFNFYCKDKIEIQQFDLMEFAEYAHNYPEEIAKFVEDNDESQQFHSLADHQFYTQELFQKDSRMVDNGNEGIPYCIREEFT